MGLPCERLFSEKLDIWSPVSNDSLHYHVSCENASSVYRLIYALFLWDLSHEQP